MSLTTHQQFQNPMGESSMPYTRGSPADKHGERKSVITSSSASTGKYLTLINYLNNNHDDFVYTKDYSSLSNILILMQCLGMGIEILQE